MNEIGHSGDTHSTFSAGTGAHIHFTRMAGGYAVTDRAVPGLESIGQLIRAAVASLEEDPSQARKALNRASELLSNNPVDAVSIFPRPSSQTARGALATWQLKKLLLHIESRLEYPITAQELADVIGVSRGQLFRAFKVSTGIQPLHYVAATRVRLAQKLMCTTRDPLAQIALACGLYDQPHFCRTFRRIVGQSPNKWRRVHAPEPVDLHSSTIPSTDFHTG